MRWIDAALLWFIQRGMYVESREIPPTREGEGEEGEQFEGATYESPYSEETRVCPFCR